MSGLMGAFFFYHDGISDSLQSGYQCYIYISDSPI